MLRPLWGVVLLAGLAGGGAALAATCQAESGATVTPVVELYTSESCSSCPQADQWMSGFKGKAVVALAFHVDYWNHLSWVDRFSSPQYTQRQREVARLNRQNGVYTPQLVRNGMDWRQWYAGQPVMPVVETAPVRIKLEKTGPLSYQAQVQPISDETLPWAAYWAVTENGHSTQVKAGENAGEFLQHDFVVRQYQPVDQRQGASLLKLEATAPTGSFARRIQLVVFNPKTGKPYQALALSCA